MDKIAKAIVSGLAAFLGVWTVATSDSSPAGDVVSANEWVSIAVTSVIAGLAVWAVPNTTPPDDSDK